MAGVDPPPIDVKRTLERARALYLRAIAKPIDSNGRAKDIIAARGLVGQAKAYGQMQGIKIEENDSVAALVVALDNVRYRTGTTPTPNQGGRHGQEGRAGRRRRTRRRRS